MKKFWLVLCCICLAVSSAQTESWTDFQFASKENGMYGKSTNIESRFISTTVLEKRFGCTENDQLKIRLSIDGFFLQTQTPEILVFSLCEKKSGMFLLNAKTLEIVRQFKWEFIGNSEDLNCGKISLPKQTDRLLCLVKFEYSDWNYDALFSVDVSSDQVQRFMIANRTNNPQTQCDEQGYSNTVQKIQYRNQDLRVFTESASGTTEDIGGGVCRIDTSNKTLSPVLLEFRHIGKQYIQTTPNNTLPRLESFVPVQEGIEFDMPYLELGEPFFKNLECSGGYLDSQRLKFNSQKGNELLLEYTCKATNRFILFNQKAKPLATYPKTLLGRGCSFLPSTKRLLLCAMASGAGWRVFDLSNLQKPKVLWKLEFQALSIPLQCKPRDGLVLRLLSFNNRILRFDFWQMNATQQEPCNPDSHGTALRLEFVENAPNAETQSLLEQTKLVRWIKF